MKLTTPQAHLRWALLAKVTRLYSELLCLITALLLYRAVMSTTVVAFETMLPSHSFYHLMLKQRFDC